VCYDTKVLAGPAGIGKTDLMFLYKKVGATKKIYNNISFDADKLPNEKELEDYNLGVSVET
jgi:hypothetical protein